MIRKRNSPLFWSLHIHIDCIKHPGDSNVCKYKTCAYSISMISCSFTYIYQSSQDHAAHLPLVNADFTCRSGLKWSWEWAFIGLRVQIIVSPDKQLHFSPAKRRICSMINELAKAVTLFVFFIGCFCPDECRMRTGLRRQLRRRVSEIAVCLADLWRWMHVPYFSKNETCEVHPMNGPLNVEMSCRQSNFGFGCSRFETSPLACVDDSPERGTSNEGARFNAASTYRDEDPDAENSCH